MQVSEIIFGPPGTGKTTTLLGRLDQELQQRGTPPQRIAFVSFTRKATVEARQRAIQKFKLSSKDFMYFRTIHSLAYRRLALRPGDVMQKADWEQIGEDMACSFSGDYDLSGGADDLRMSKDGDLVLALISVARARRLPWQQGYDVRVFRGHGMSEHRYRAIANAIEEYKELRGLVDFTDMLEACIARTDPLDVDVAIIDEAQDLSALQWQVCEHLFANTKRVYIAGDDDQAIYRWAGADVSHLQHCQGPRTVLQRSYRLPARVWSQAQGILRNISQRVPKEWTHRGEEGHVEVLAAAEYAPIDKGEWLMLARTRWTIKELANNLWKRGVPCTLHGTPTVATRHVAAIRAWDDLRAGTAVKAVDVAAVYAHTSGVPEDFNVDTLPKDQLFTYAELAAKYGLRTPVTADWFAALDLIPYSTCQFYERCHINGFDIMAPPRIHLNTVHAVKGGECDNVLLLGDVTAQMGATLRHPSTEECDDEHRVFYVGATRARQALYAARASGPNEYPLPCFYE